MGQLTLRDMAIDLLVIDRDFFLHQPAPYHAGFRASDYELYTFEQTWGNTAGGLEGNGGSAMTTQRTYVFIPNHDFDTVCFVYFGSNFGYKQNYTEEFMRDVTNHKVKGRRSRRYGG